MHTLAITLRQNVPGTLASELGSAVCAVVASTWRPSTVKLTDSVTNHAAREGNWKIGVGYRTWINTEVGTVTQAAKGLTVTKVAGGALISAPDNWSAVRVVAAMTETLGGERPGRDSALADAGELLRHCARDG